jgi:3-phenylpropionate/cinnamic acid dioxygenase small subunit
MSERIIPAAMDLRTLQFEIEQFLFHEADLLDSHRYDQWLELFTDDIRYLMPVRTNTTDTGGRITGENGVPLFDEDMQSLRMRISRLKDPTAWAETPPSRTRRIIGNIMLAPEKSGEIRVRSNFIVFKLRGDRHRDIFAGSRNDLLRFSEQSTQWRIARRTIALEETVLSAINLSIFF